jgi:hypothetical protein
MRLAATLTATLLALPVATPAEAQMTRYECLTTVIEGRSRVERNQRAARNGAEADWVAAARTRHGFAYRWALAQESRGIRNAYQNNGWVASVEAYPCRIFVERPNQGTLTVNETERERTCRTFPSLEVALRNNCSHFYPLRR